MTNCKNCGAVLSRGRYCQYCGADSGRTEHIEIKMPIINVPTKTIVANLPAPMELGDNEDLLKKYLLSKICSKIYDDIDSMVIKKDDFSIDPINLTVTYQAKFYYAFL